MNFSIISKSLGTLVMLVGLSMISCMLLGWLIPSHRSGMAVSYNGWWLSVAITMLTGGLAYGIGKFRLRGGRDKKIFRREAIVVVGLGWILCSFFASLPHYLCIYDITWAQAIFESCSGFTTTGSSIFPSVEALSETTLLWRSVTQWLGGMGILGAFLLIFSGESRGKTLLSFESSIHGADLSSSDLRSAMRSLWRIYLGLTVITIIGLWIQDMTLFQAVNHGMTATATGGFGTENDSINSFSAGVKLWLSFSMLLCGISFPLYVALLKRKDISILKRHEETRWYLIIVAVAITIIIISNYFWVTHSSVVDVIFDVTTIITTTGFIVGDYETWPVFSKQVIMLLMIVGGCSGSTAGGLKVSRMLLWIRSMKNEIIRGFRPNVVLKLQMNGKAVDDQVIRSVYVVTSVAVVFFLAGSMAITLLEPELDVITCASAVLSSICNIGPAFSELGPTQNFSILSAPSLGVLSMLMILGRLEFIAVLVLLSRRLWRKY
ncbi:MAG: trk system potassium uptake protein TrkH [Cryomorphaceae bacterium]|jgi:trk system potassium uptake protein TrkH